MRTSLILTLSMIAASLAFAPGASAACSEITRAATAADVTASATLGECSFTYSDPWGSGHSYTNTTEVGVSSAALGEGVHVRYTEQAYGDEYPGCCGGSQTTRNVMVYNGDEPWTSDTVVTTGFSDYENHGPAYCNGWTYAGVSVARYGESETNVAQSVGSGNGRTLPCGWNDAVLP